MCGIFQLTAMEFFHHDEGLIWWNEKFCIFNIQLNKLSRLAN